MALVERIRFQHIENDAGSIVVAESERSVPFAIQRVYYLFGVPAEQRRGAHAHKTLTQVAVCVKGSVRFRLDNGRESEEVVLSRPNEGIVIRPMFWRDMYDFSSDCVLMVLASAHYDERDYIRNYDEFIHASR
jgi:dTDP-4-dehydrorhamnose 3,5-epimerase-like enzyme